MVNTRLIDYFSFVSAITVTNFQVFLRAFATPVTNLVPIAKKSSSNPSNRYKGSAQAKIFLYVNYRYRAVHALLHVKTVTLRVWREITA